MLDFPLNCIYYLVSKHTIHFLLCMSMVWPLDLDPAIHVWVRVSQFWFGVKIRFLKRLHCIHSGCEKWPRRQIWTIVSKWQFVTFKMMMTMAADSEIYTDSTVHSVAIVINTNMVVVRRQVVTFWKISSSTKLCISAVAHLIDDFVEQLCRSCMLLGLCCKWWDGQCE